MRKMSIVFALLVAVGCSTPSDQQNSESDEATDEAQQGVEEREEDERAAPKEEAAPEKPAAPLWSEEGLDVQQRVEDLAQQPTRSPETTPWRDADFEVPEQLAEADEEGPPTPGALLVELVAALDVGAGLGTEVWEQTIRVMSEEDRQAVGVVLQWGFKDDSVAGMDLRAHMRQGDGGWYIEALEQRVHCARGVTDGMCL